MQHTPVLLQEVLTYLNPISPGRYVDGTAGGGGHIQAILSAAAPDGEVLGIDRDPEAIARLTTRFAGEPRVSLWHGRYEEIDRALQMLDWTTLDGVLLDLGLSSYQLDDPARGFSFQNDTALDLRFDQTDGVSAAGLLAEVREHDLADILYNYGDFRDSRRLAKTIIDARQNKSIRTTQDLLEATHFQHPRKRAQLFQALRIAVNDELGSLVRALPKIWAALAPGGRVVCISFHSGEDRIVKNQFRLWAASGEGTILTKKPVVAGTEEQDSNPRARSAKLRAIQKSQ